MNRYAMVAVEMTKPSTRAKSAVMLSEPNLLIRIAATITTVAMMPDMMLMAIGVPYLPLENQYGENATDNQAEFGRNQISCVDAAMGVTGKQEDQGQQHEDDEQTKLDIRANDREPFPHTQGQNGAPDDSPDKDKGNDY